MVSCRTIFFLQKGSSCSLSDSLSSPLLHYRINTTAHYTRAPKAIATTLRAAQASKSLNDLSHKHQIGASATIPSSRTLHFHFHRGEMDTPLLAEFGRLRTFDSPPRQQQPADVKYDLPIFATPHRVSRFKLAPKETKALQKHPSFLTTVDNYKVKKATKDHRRPDRRSQLLRLREPRPGTPFDKVDMPIVKKALRPSLPFDEENSTDPWEFFPELQRPFSPMRDDTSPYQRQAAEAEAAQAARPYQRGSPLSFEERVDSMQMILHMGRYASPPKRSEPTLLPQTPQAPQSVSMRTYSPMDVDG